MSIVVKIPMVFRSHVDGQRAVDAQGSSVREVLRDLSDRYPALSGQLFNGDELHRFVNVYLNDEDVRYVDGLQTKVSEGDTLAILPAVAGG